MFLVTRDLQKERYLYLFNSLSLQAGVGALDAPDIQKVEELTAR
jgi:hypothetical protein